MNWLTDTEFFGVLIESRTFLVTLAEASVVFLLGFMVLFFLIKKYIFQAGSPIFKSKLSLVKDQDGAASAVDFVLVIPFFMFIMCMFVQMAMIVNASLIVHYSAFSAARSARAHFCDRPVNEYLVGYLGCSVNSKVRREAEKAARFVLIAASPVDESVSSSGTPPEELLNWLSQEYLERNSSLVTQARYAFDSRNVDVEVKPAESDNAILQGQYLRDRIPPADVEDWINKKLRNTWPVTVTVKYVKHLGVPLMGPFLSDEQRGNDHFQTIEAEVTLL